MSTTTNQAFINAYHGTSSQSTVQPVRGDRFAEAFVGTSELVSATASDSSSAAPVEIAIESDTTSTLNTPRTDRPAPAIRRPLSAVQADELFALDPPAAKRSEAQWPDMCQQLLARGADRYDAVLRKLPTGTTGTLVGVVGTAPQSGCTTTAICLALRSSALGYTAALMDGNLAYGGLALALRIDRYASWGDMLNTNTSIATAITPAEDVGVDLLLTNALDEPGFEATARFRTSLAAGVLRRKYERVIIDLGCPTHENASLVAELTAAMGIDFLMATATPATTQANLESTSAALGEYGLELAGVIEAV